MHSFTLGPWELESRGWDGQFIYGHDERAHGRRFIADVSLDFDGAEANARLIAASPSLYHMVKQLMAVIEDGISDPVDIDIYQQAKALLATLDGGAA